MSLLILTRWNYNKLAQVKIVLALRWAAWITLGIAWIWIFVGMKHHHPDFSDLQVYYLAGKKAVHHMTVYDVIGHYQFKYAPFIAYVFGVLTAPFEFDQIKWVTYFLSLGLWLVLFLTLVLQTSREKSWFEVGLFAALAMSGIGLRDELKLGQINVIPYSLIIFMATYLKEPQKTLFRDILAGMALSFAIQMKLYCLILLPYLLLKKEWKILGVSLAGIIFFNGAVLAWMHGPHLAWDELERWLTTLHGSSKELLFSSYNVSLIGIAGKWIPIPAFYITMGLMGLVAFFYFQYQLAHDSNVWINTAFALSSITILSPLVWPYWMLLNIPIVLSIIEERMKIRPLSFRWSDLLIFIFFLMACLQNHKIVHQGGLLLATLAILGLFLLQELKPRQA